MANSNLSDDDRLTEVGRILAQGALRIISKKLGRAAKTGVVVSSKRSVNSCMAHGSVYKGEENARNSAYQ